MPHTLQWVRVTLSKCNSTEIRRHNDIPTVGQPHPHAMRYLKGNFTRFCCWAIPCQHPGPLLCTCLTASCSQTILIGAFRMSLYVRNLLRFGRVEGGFRWELCNWALFRRRTCVRGTGPLRRVLAGLVRGMSLEWERNVLRKSWMWQLLERQPLLLPRGEVVRNVGGHNWFFILLYLVLLTAKQNRKEI